jgi:hypothetical protein
MATRPRRCAPCLPALAEAVALYRDDFMAGFSLRDRLRRLAVLSGGGLRRQWPARWAAGDGLSASATEDTGSRP